MKNTIKNLFGYKDKTVVISGAASGMAKSATELLYDDTLAWYNTHPDAIKDSYVFSKQCMLTYVKSRAHTPQYTDRRIRLSMQSDLVIQ